MRRGFGQRPLHEITPHGEPGFHSRLGFFRQGRARDLRPHIAQRREAEQVHVVVGARAGVVGFRHGVLHEPHGRLLEVADALFHSIEIRRHLRRRRVFLREGLNLVEKRRQRAPAVLRQFAPHEVERLNAVGALVDHGDARVADELLHAGFGDVAMAAEHLLRLDGVVETAVGQHALEHGRHQSQEVVGAAALLLVRRAARDVGLQQRPDRQRPRALVERADVEQHAPDIGMHEDGIGWFVGRFRPAQRTPLQTVARVGGGVLIGDVGNRHALHGDAEPRLVHHHEHGVEALVGLADEKPLRLVVVHHAGGIGVNAHFVFDGAARHRVAGAKRAIGVRQKLRHDEQRDAARARRRALDARQHEVHDVVGEIVFAGGYENLLSGDRVGAVAVGLGARLQQAKIGAAVGLGQVHGAGPFARHHLRQVLLLQFRRRVLVDRRDRALRQAGIHGESHVGRGRKLVDERRERIRKALSAIFRVRGEADPAAFRIGLVGFLETLRRGHGTVGVAHAALAVARKVERLQNLFGNLSAFFQNRFNDVGRGVRKAGQIAMPAPIENIVEQKQGFFDGRFVCGHGELQRLEHRHKRRLVPARSQPMLQSLHEFSSYIN